jgi:hypothetical protein
VTASRVAASRVYEKSTVSGWGKMFDLLVKALG